MFAVVASISVALTHPGEPGVIAFGALVAAAVVGVWAVTRREISVLLKERRRQWFASAPRGLAQLDGKLRIVEANSRLGNLLAMADRNLTGLDLADCFGADQAEAIAAQLRELHGTSSDATEGELAATRPDGSQVWLRWRASVVTRSDGEFDYYLVTFEDSTAQHAAHEAAVSNLSELEKLNQLRKEFASTVSHEFRTALTGIQGMSELIASGTLEPQEVLEYAGYIFKEAERINRLISDMLDLERLDAGKMTLRMAPVNLNATMTESSRRLQAGAPRHVITTHLDPSSPRVRADPDRLVQVIANLTSNAIQHSPNGSEITISSWVRGDFVEISVKDQGTGIPVDIVDRLFGRFERYENTSSAVIGTGLGLAVARQIIELHGGKIWVESSGEGGSDFHFTLPLVGAGMEAVRLPD